MRLRCTTFALLAALATGAAAGTPEGHDDWLAFQAAAVGNSAASGLKSARGFGLSGGQWLTPRWAWEASALRDPVEERAGHWDSSEVHVHGSVLFDPLPEPGRWRPFARLGLGLSGGVYEPPLAAPGTLPGLGLSAAQLDTANTPSTTTRVSLLAGVGVQAFLGSHGFASLEARQLRVQVTAASARVETQALLGVGYRWHTPGAVPVQAPPPEPPAPPAPPQEAPPPAPEPMPVPDFGPRPAPEPEPAEEAPLPSRIVLDDSVLPFEPGSDRMSREGERALRDLARRLRRRGGFYRLEVIGHTSASGSRARDRALSLRRAKAVARVLIQAGVPGSRITTRGVGSDEPVASDATARGRSRNNRVEILIHDGPDREAEARRRAAAHAHRRHRPARRKAKGAIDS